MRDYIVTSPVDHDQRHYPIGSSILGLSDDVAAPLIAAHAIALPDVAVARVTDTLLGSDFLPPLIRLTRDLTVKLSEAVERAFIASGLDHAGWNGLPDDDRELRISASLELMREQALEGNPDRAGLGTRLAIAEAARVAQDNASTDPKRDTAERFVVQHETGMVDAGAPVVTTSAAGVASGEAAVVVDPVAATHTKTSKTNRRPV
jgi:hypothetical protein